MRTTTDDELMSHAAMPVRRIRTETGGTVDPPLDQRWSKLEKLRWHAGVVVADTGIEVEITTGCYSDRDLLGRTRVRRDVYGIEIGNSAHIGYSYDEAWTFLTGVTAGARAVRTA